MKRSTWMEIAYYIVLLWVSWEITQDVPFRVRFWYYTHRGSWALARTFARIDMHAEKKYRKEIGKEQTI